MKNFFLLLLFSVIFPGLCFAQNAALPQNFLFDDSDIIVTAPETPEEKPVVNNSKEAINEAMSSARALLNQKPTKLKQKNFANFKSKSFAPTSPSHTKEPQNAPFGLLWGAAITDTRSQGVQLTPAELKDSVNSFLADKLPKPISFFERIYVVYGKENELQRILAYSKLIEDEPSASKILGYYNSYSELLNKKYGNKEEEFTPATITKTVKDAKGHDETVQEQAPIGNPDFLAQLESGNAVLYSTYYNKDIAVALSIGVDGDKKSYIVIDYKNLHILEKQEAKTLDAL